MSGVGVLLALTHDGRLFGLFCKIKLPAGRRRYQIAGRINFGFGPALGHIQRALEAAALIADFFL